MLGADADAADDEDDADDDRHGCGDPSGLIVVVDSPMPVS